MPFYRPRAGNAGSNRALAPTCRTAVAAVDATSRAASNRSDGRIPELHVGVDGISSDTPGASVLVEQTGPDRLTISEIVDGQTVGQIALPVITVPTPEADAPAPTAARQVSNGGFQRNRACGQHPQHRGTSAPQARFTVSRVASAVVRHMSWSANGDGSYTITPGDGEAVSISGDSSVAVVVAVPIPSGPA